MDYEKKRYLDLLALDNSTENIDDTNLEHKKSLERCDKIIRRLAMAELRIDRILMIFKDF